MTVPSGLMIYEPKGAAREYAARACNIYAGCDHGCAYCYAPDVTHRERDQFTHPAERKGFLAKLECDAAKVKPGEPVFLCFTCDAYSHFDAEHAAAQDAIKILHAHGHKVSVLSKGGTRALRDLNLFGPGDSYGATLTFIKDADSLKWEPGAALPADRIEALRRFHSAGISTFASIEPVIDPAQSLALIERTASYVDEFRVGRWNHDARANAIDWQKFGLDAIALLKRLGNRYIVKDALRRYLPGVDSGIQAGRTGACHG